jgi:hypothetical protein
MGPCAIEKKRESHNKSKKTKSIDKDNETLAAWIP